MTEVAIVITARNQAQAAFDAVKNDLAELERRTQGLGNTLKSVSAELGKTGAALTAGITLPIVGVAAAATKSAADFEASMNVMRQVSGATEEQMASLQAQALQLGIDTSFSAGEAADAMLELAKAGLTAEEVSGAIGGTLDMAAAGGIDLAMAAEIAANAVNAFGLNASETVRVADMLAAAANASSSDIGDLSMGMKMAGAVFASSGQSLDDLTTAMAIMANAGIKGSDAGTSLKTMLIRLSAPTDKAAEALAGLGVSMYNLDGSTRELPAVLADLQAATANLTDEQRSAALVTIFGADALRAVNVLSAAGVDGWNAMAEAVGKQGAASEVANARMSGLSGALLYAQGSMDSLMISTLLPFLDSMSGIVRYLADAASAFGTLDQSTKNAALAFAAVLAAAGPLLLVLSAVSAAIAFLATPIGLVVVASAALAAAWAMNFGGIQEIAASTWTAIQDATTAAWAVIGPVIDQSIAGFASYAASIADAGMGSIEARESISMLPEAMQPVVAAFDTLGASIQSTWGTVFPQVMAAAQAAWEQFSALLAPAIERLQASFATAQADVGALGPKFAELATAVQNMWVAVQPALEAFGVVIGAVVAVTSVLAVNLLSQAFSSLGMIAGTVISQITLTLNTIATVLSEVAILVTAIINGDWTTAFASARNIVEAFKVYFEETFNNLLAIVSTIVTGIATAVVDTLKDMGVDTEGVMAGVTGWWNSAWGDLTKKVQPVIDMIGEFRKTLEGFASWVSGFSIPNPFANWSMPAMPSLPGWPGSTPQNQLGTSYWSGGPTWVGEAGREIVVPPRGSAIIPNRDIGKTGLAGAADRIAITVQQMVVRDDKDVYALAYQVADILARG